MRISAAAARSRIGANRATGAVRILAAAMLLNGLTGCETLTPVTMGVGMASYMATGKGLADHAIGSITQSDCNILEGLLSGERRICEPRGTGVLGRVAPTGPSKAGTARAPALRLSDTFAALADVDDAGVGVPSSPPALRLSDSIEFTPSRAPAPRAPGDDIEIASL